MPRIRTIKPEFFQDEKLAPLAPIDRLVFLGLISMADDAGRLLDNLKVIDAFIFPCSDDTSRNSLDTLARLARIVRYTSESGQKLIQIRNWTDHQKVDHAARHVLPAPTDADIAQVTAAPAVADSTAGDSGEPRENVATSSRLDLGPRTNDLRSNISRRSGAADTDDLAFQAAWKLYPARASGNSRKAALKAWHARIAQGIDPGELRRATEHYGAYIRLAGKEHTEFVMQGATFYGPNERWREFLEPVKPPPASANGHAPPKQWAIAMPEIPA